jgi:hypothetical protein
MKNNLTLIAFAAFLLVFVAGVSSVSADTTNGSDDAVTPVITTPSETTNPTVDNGSDDAVTPPAQNEQTGGNTTPSSSNGEDDAPTPQTPVDTGGGDNTGGNTGGTTGGGGFVPSGSNGSTVTVLSVASTTTLPATTVAPASCPLITDYLKFGGANNQIQVSKLQAFLKNVEKLDVDVNGTFDKKTEAAVMAFQQRYAELILGPWEASQPSGFAYITTIKVINEIACTSRFTLTADEQAIIDAYKKRRDNSSEQSTEIGQTDSTTASTTGTLEVGTTETQDNDNVAAVGRTSVLSRFWNFIKELFQ